MRTTTTGAARTEDRDEPMSAGSIIATFLPLVLLLAMFVFIVRFVRKSTQRTGEYVKRMEANGDRMIAILEEIRDELAKRSK